MLNLEKSEYFKTLPKLIRDTVVLGNIQFTDEDELRKFVTYMSSLNQ